MGTVTLLRARPGLRLAKVWQPNFPIQAAANAKWFEAKEIRFASLSDLLMLLETIELWRRVALVKEAIAPGADPLRLRRTCNTGVDKKTGEAYLAGLRVVARRSLILDIDKLPRPASIDWRDGDALARHARGMLPLLFKNSACVWQFSGSSGHPSKRAEIRMHLFFMLDEPVLPLAWKATFAHLPFLDNSVFDGAKLIFTAAPIILTGNDPISYRHGILSGASVVTVPADVIARSAAFARGEARSTHAVPVATAPMSRAAAAFVEIVAKSNILRSQHPNYRNDRGRRLAFCKMIRTDFGIEDESILSEAFHQACIGDEDPNADHDTSQALTWVTNGSPTGRDFSIRKLCCDAAVALHTAGEVELASRAARLAMLFGKVEMRVAQTEEN
jgi:hypothetical protein